MKPEKKELVREAFARFLERRIGTIRRLRLVDLDINPFLLRLLSRELKLTKASSIIRWLVHQRFERGAVTSFGLALQDIAKIFSEGTGVEGADVIKTKEGRHYHIQVKSGPNTVPKDMAERITELLRSAQRRNRGSIALFGMCYGNPEQVSGIVQKYVGVDWLIGRDFWKFISDDPKCIDEIYALAEEVSGSFRDAKGQSLEEILETKIIDLTKEFEELYGKSGKAMWEKLLGCNS